VSSTTDRHREALAANPDDVRAFEALQEHYFLEGAWEELVALYRARLESPALAEDAAQRAQLLFRMGQVLEERCDRVAEAEEIYWEVARLTPQFRPAMRQLRHIYDGRAQWDMVLQIAELEGQIPMPPVERAHFLADLGEVWLDHLDDPGEAQTCFETALDGEPHEQKALEGLARVHQRFGRHAEAAAMYERLIGVLRGPERAPALVSLGKLYAGPLRQTERATACFRRAMTDDPRNEDAVEALLVIASAQEQWPLLADLYERRFDLACGARHRSAIAVEAGTMHLERLRRPDLARRWFERARELVDDEPAVHLALAELERAQGRTDALRDALDGLIGLGASRAPVSVLLEAADLHAESGDTRRALQYLEIANRRKPDDPLVLEALSDALSTAGRTTELADVLERRAALATDDADARADALLELSRIHEEELGDPEAALDALARAFDANPQRLDLSAGLQRLYRKTERWSELRTVLERAAGQARGADRVRLATELGALLADHLDDLDGARRAFEAALAVDARHGAALAGLERIARATGDDETLLRVGEAEASDTSDPDRLAALVPELVPLLEARHAPERALALVERLLAVRPDDASALATAARLQEALGFADRRLETLQRLDPLLEGAARAANRRALAALQRAAGDVEGAIASLEAAAESDPDDVESLSALVEHYEGADRLADVARVQRRLVNLLPPAERAPALARLATLLEVRLGDIDGAIVVLWKLIEQPDRPDDATDRLEALLERAGRFEDLAQLLAERRRGVADTEPGALALDLRRARLLMDHLGQIEQATALYRSMRSRHPDCAQATEGLEQALRSSGDSAGLADLLERRAREEHDPTARAHLDLERAILLEESIGDEPAALALLEQLADGGADPSVATLAGARIERLLERRGDWPVLRARLEAALEAGDGSDALVLHERLAALCRDRLADRETAIAHLEAIGAADASRGQVWQDLAQLYEELDRTDDWLRAVRAELATRPPAERALVLHARAARLAVERVGAADADPEAMRERARDHYEHVLEIDPGHSEASEYLIAFYELQDRPEDVARLLEARLAEAPRSADDGDRTYLSLALRLAEVRAERLDDRAGAIRLLEETIGDGAVPASLAVPLADLYEAEGLDEPLMALARRAAAAAPGPRERADWTTRLAAALARRGDERAAADAYCQVLVDRPGDREVESALRELYRSLDEPEPLAALLEAEIPRARPARQSALRLELADLLSERLDRTEEALEHLQAVLRAEPDHEAALDAALALSEKLGRETDVLALIDLRLDATPPGPERARLLERRGDLLAGALDRPEEAASAYREAVALSADPRRARESLCAVMERLGRWSAVLDCLHLEAQAAEATDRVAVLERAVAIAREHLPLDATLPWLERLRDERPADPDVLARMAEVHRTAGRPEALLRALEQQIELVDDETKRRDLHVACARVLERDLRAPGRALRAYETAIELVPADAEVLSELDRLYDLMGRMRERVTILERRIDVVSEARDRIDLHRQAAILYATSLADPERAIPHWLRAVSLADADEHASRAALLRELAETLRTAGRLDAWSRAAEEELRDLDPGAEVDVERAAELHLELADVYDRALGLPDAGVHHLRAVLALARPERGGARLPDESIDRAEAMLIDRLRGAGHHAELAERLGARLERRGGEAEEWLELGQLHAERLHDLEAAAAAFREVLARQPADLNAIRGLRSVAERQCDWNEVTRTLELELDAPERWTPHQRVALHRRLGEVCWHRLGALDRAAEAFTAALEARPAAVEVLRQYQELEEQRGHSDRAVELLEREITQLGEEDPTRRRGLWLRVAQLAREATGEPRRALRALEAASEIGPLDAADQRAWADLYRESGDTRRFAETFAVWCDDAAADATPWDHLALAAALEELGQADAALARARRACSIDPAHAGAWDTVAELLEASGSRGEAAEALEKAAALHTGADAARRYVAAAGLVDPSRPESIASLLRRATEADPGHARAHAALAAVAERLDETDEAEFAAGRALDIAEVDDALDRETRLACALIGGRAARAADRSEAAARFFDAALALDPEHREALDAACEVAFAREDWPAAGALAESRLALGGDDPERSRHLAIAARGLEAAGETGAAVARYREALERTPGLDLAHDGLVRIHTASGDDARLLDALRAWIDHDADDAHRARLRTRAARGLAAAGRLDDAERHLRAAVDEDPGNEEAWTQLVELLQEAERPDALLVESERALAHLESDAARARVAGLRARLLEARGEPRAAAEAYGEAARRDPRAVDAALGEARLLRAMGDWHASAEAIARFVEEHPDPDSVALAPVHLEWGRLASGPLEDVPRAIGCYERALELCPALSEAREPLAALLAHVPDRWRDAVASHRALLAESPARGASLRSLLEIARRRDRTRATGIGLAILRALGAASPGEAAEAPQRIGIALAGAARMAEPSWEIARRICSICAAEIAQVLVPEAADDDTAEARLPDTILRRHQATLSAPGLADLDVDALSSLVFTVTALSVDPGGNCPDSPHLHALDAALGRWARRKVRRTLGDIDVRDIQSIDYAAWRDALRVMAACAAIDASEIDLRAALLALMPAAGRDAAETADLSARIDREPAARALLGRVVDAWCAELLDGRD
jgi:tetratricopeptide (TPR) repeat protein